MEDSTLLNISITCSIIGIVALLILSYFSVIPEKTYNDITNSDIDSKVKVTGTIQQIQGYNTSTVIKIKQDCVTTVNMFETNQNLSVGENVTIEGKVQEFNGKLNIQAEKITKIKK